MKKSLFLAFVFAAGCFFAPVSGSAAVDTQTIAAPLEKSRMLALALGRVTDRKNQDQIVQQVKEASIEVDTALAEAEKDPTNTPDTIARLEEFKSIWAEFRATRENEIIPALLAGKRDEARRITTMLQTGRYKRMMSLLEP